MLKLLIGCVMSLVILLASAYAPPAYAASANLVLTQIQAGGAAAALQELIVIYNNSPEEADISSWCVQNKSGFSFACLHADDPSQALILPSHSFATIASQAYDDAINVDNFTTVYQPTNQSSGSIVGGNDSITLVDQAGTVIDSHSWSTSLIGGMSFVRNQTVGEIATYIDTDQSSDWAVKSPTTTPGDQTIDRDREAVPEPLPAQLSELLPNAAGSDVGKEFIELYNPNESVINIGGYVLWYGQELDKSVGFAPEATIEPLSYRAFSNTDIGYSLLNSSSRVRLVAPDGATIDETPAYDDPEDDASWALIDTIWQYTNQPTPNGPNAASLTSLISSTLKSSSETSSAPCAANQYRSPETNRCRLIATTTTQTPCKDNQYRSEETGRCRNIATTDAPAACKEGQERNPETNRCRNIVKMSNADYGVLGAQTTSGNNNLYIWLAVGAVLLLALAYTIWEWRQEIGGLFKKARGFVRLKK